MNLFKKKFNKKINTTHVLQPHAQGLLIYNSVNDVIHAEKVIKKSGFDDIQVVAPPARYRTGCDLSIKFSLIDQIAIVRNLTQHSLEPEDIIIVDEEHLRPTEICSIKDFGGHVMVRAANMKIVFDKESLIIVNISGGGCSDVPYLACRMIGKKITDAPSPREIGFTLCAYTLAIAFDKARKDYT